MKRYFSLFLGIVLILGMFGGSLAFADDPALDPPITIDPVEGGGFTIKDSSGEGPDAEIQGTEITSVDVVVAGSETTLTVETDGGSKQKSIQEFDANPDITVNTDVQGQVSVKEEASNNTIDGTVSVGVSVQGDVENTATSTGSDAAIAVEAAATATAKSSDSAIKTTNNGSITIDITGNAKGIATCEKFPYAYAVREDSEAKANSGGGDPDVAATAINNSTIMVTVGGNASATATSTSEILGHAHAYAVSVYSENSGVAENNSEMTVIVEGDAKATAISNGQRAEAYAINANNMSGNSKVEVTVKGNAETTAKTSGENTLSSATGVYANNATVDVEKSISATGENASATGVNAYNATVNVGGDVTATADEDATGIVAAKGASVTVGGDVQSSGDAIEVAITNVAGDEKSSVVVEGTVSAENHTLELKVSDAFDDTPENISTVINNLPEIIVQTIAPDADIVVTAPNLSENSKAAVTNEMFAQISYIVTTNNMDEAKVSIVGTEEKKVGDTTYVVAHENDTITVKNIGDGKIVGVQVGGENPIAQVQDNGDGSWTITVCRGGNLDINVTYEDAKQEEPEVQPEPEEQKSVTPDTSAQPVNITVTPSTGDVFTGPMLLTLGSGENSNVLTVNMIYINKTDILVSTFQNFANQGYDTVQIQTAGGIYSITMAELLSLANGGSLITFVIRGDLLEVYVDWQLVMTLALTRTSV